MDANLIGVVAGTLALLGSCSGAAGSAPGAGEPTEPITSRAVAAQALTHLSDHELPAGSGHDEVSESGAEEVHLAVWSLDNGTELVVGVSREDDPEDGTEDTDAFDGTCDGAREEGVASCRELTVDRQKVIVFSSHEDLTGGIYEDGITWAAAAQRPDGDAVMASLMITEIGDHEAWRTGKDLPVSLDALAEIAADPLIALRTTPDVITAGDELKGFRDQR